METEAKKIEGPTNNMAPISSQIESVADFDWVEFRIGARWELQRFETFWAHATEIRDRCRESGLELFNEPLFVSESECGVELPYRANFRSTGARSGLMFPVRFEYFGMTFLVRRGDLEQHDCKMVVTIPGKALRVHGFDKLLETMDCVVEKIGALDCQEVVSRADIRADLLNGPRVEEFEQAQRAGCVIRRADNVATIVGRDDKPETITVGGGGSIVLRIYDKKREAMRNPDDWADVCRMWGIVPETATRVEFQVRREQLRKLDITTRDDLRGKAKLLAGWLTDKWFRIAEKPVDRNHHQSRSVMSKMWVCVRNAFGAIGGIRPKTPEKKPERKHLRQQIIGCIASYVALVTRDAEKELTEFFDSWMPQIWGKVSARRDVFIASGIVSPTGGG